MEYLLLSIGIVGAAGIATYFLYHFIDTKHPLNVLHYCNPWYLANGSSMLGREDLLRKKFQVAYILTLFLFMVISLLEFSTVGYVYGFSGWNAPVQSILQLGTFPIPCSIAVFFLVWYLLRAVGFLVLATVCGIVAVREMSFK